MASLRVKTVRTFSSTSSPLWGEGYKTLKQGEGVEFEVEQGQKGLQATNVSRLNPEA